MRSMMPRGESAMGGCGGSSSSSVGGSARSRCFGSTSASNAARQETRAFQQRMRNPLMRAVLEQSPRLPAALGTALLHAGSLLSLSSEEDDDGT